jgi:hypothetical protein
MQSEVIVGDSAPLLINGKGSVLLSLPEMWWLGSEFSGGSVHTEPARQPDITRNVGGERNEDCGLRRRSQGNGK